MRFACPDNDSAHSVNLNNLNQHRLLMATDVPFWRKSTGAEQRMASLVRAISADNFHIRSFYLGQSNSPQFTSLDQELIEEQNLDVEQRSSDQPPQQLGNKIGWYANATKNQFQTWAQNRAGDEEDADSAAHQTPPTPTLADYRWPWAITAFGESVSSFKPNSILIQYVKLGYLLESLTEAQRGSTQCLVDTHDVLHLRAQQFRDRGFQHWIELTRDEEATSLRQFDSIVAIQEHEAALFREMAPESKTILCGHSAGQRVSIRPLSGPTSSDSAAQTEEGPLTIGYLGSANASNLQAIESFLTTVWLPLMESVEAKEFRLVVAGGVCQWLVQSDIFEAADGIQIDLLGSIADLETFYNRVDVVVNPVEFGTGLKIKNCEAIANGKPVLTTRQGHAGFDEAKHTGILICEEAEDFINCLQELAESPQALEAMQAAAAKLSQTGFSEEQVYSELKRSLLQGK
ncbi:MAG: hypothetical protein ACI87E_003678 [Mariniblastus sp.]|jgi:hypothetical protein